MPKSRRALLGAAVLLLLCLPSCKGRDGGADGGAAARTQDAKLISLTFDDGPDPRMTPEVLDVLWAKGVKATFFVQGQHLDEYPDLGRRIVNEGHQIAGHSYFHTVFNTLRPYDQVAEIDYTNYLIWKFTGQRATLFRYPRGVHTVLADDYLKLRGLTAVDWQDGTEGDDWRCLPADAIQTRIVSGAVPGAIVVLHDGNEAAACAGGAAYLPGLIDRLRAAGYSFGRVLPSTVYSQVNHSNVRVG